MQTQPKHREHQAVQADTALYVYYHTHWDREWYLPFREYQHRLLKVVGGVLTALETGDLPCFTLDGQTVLLEDYLAFRPENQARIEALVRQERLSIGPWYVMPDEFLVSGESLIRNLQRGIAISKAFGETTFTGYLPDTFGHSADIPMLLQQFGIETAMVWRGVRPRFPVFLWESPSKDTVLTYHLTEGYFQNALHMVPDKHAQADFFEAWLAKLKPLVEGRAPLLFPVGADHLGFQPDSPGRVAELAPGATAITVDAFMETLQKTAGPVETLTGELRDNEGPYLLPGVFSSRMYLKQWNRRLEWRLIRQLEQLTTWQLLVGKQPDVQRQLDFLWQQLLLNHPHDSICGCSVDSVHRENENRFEQVDQLSNALVRDAHAMLQQQFQPRGTILMVNLGDRTYTGVIAIRQDYPLAEAVPPPVAHSQVILEEEVLDEHYLLDYNILPLSENKALRRHSLVWVTDLPAHGIKTIQDAEVPRDKVTAQGLTMENSLLKVHITAQGCLEIGDKTENTCYQNVHQLWRNLEQGDSYNAAPVLGKPPEQARFLSGQLIETGPLRATLKMDWVFPNIGLHGETWVSLMAGSPQLTFETRFRNQTPDHKIQVVFPASKPIEAVVAEGHFTPITRTYDPTYRIEAHMPAAPQKELLVQGGAIQRFVGFDNQTLITEGLTEYEVEGNALKLTLLRAFGMLSKGDTGVRGSHAGPPLPTPEGQCLYRELDFRYAWLPGFDACQAYNQADVFYGAVYGFDRTLAPTANLSEDSRSFISWDNPSVYASATVPQAESWQLRLCNPTPVPQAVRLDLPASHGPITAIDLAGQTQHTVAPEQLLIPPFQIQTFRISVQ